MFDRLVCMNGGNPREDLIEHKDPEKRDRVSSTRPNGRTLSRNHLEGRTAAFFCYGTAAATSSTRSAGRSMLRHKEWFDPTQRAVRRHARRLAPLVWQCRYSGTSS